MRLQLIGVLAVFGFLSVSAGLLGKGKDILGSGVDIATGVAKSIPDYLEPKQVFELGKQSLLGYPVEVIASAINTICEYFMCIYCFVSRDLSSCCIVLLKSSGTRIQHRAYAIGDL